ncbi:MAG: NADH:ubiquinone reductase (Na(+)-transporting) subunit C [Bacteroidia bacterium]|nr:NADH:ubiquinone reductase (Na(+)-transporting) subunit C [Bacteroidia bacterium]
MQNNNSVIGFILALTFVVALILALLQNGLKPIHDKNEALYSKKATLAAVADHIDGDFNKINNDQIQDIFDSQIKQMVLNSEGSVVESAELESLGVKGGMAENLDLTREQKKKPEDRLLPLYVYTKSDGSKYYIVYTRGKGLWDEIWGNIALEEDLKTLAGVSFDHKAETPGLGAEIKDNKEFKAQFIGKKIYDDNGNYTSVYVRKGGAKDPVHEVDGISGATITADGVTEMLQRGLKAYEPYLKTIKS